MSKINVEHIRLLDLDLMTNTSVTVIGDSMKLAPLPRTNTEYVKVTESIFGLRDEFERGELFNKSLDCSGDFVVINSETVLFACASVGNIYRRTEKEIDERQEFVERCMSSVGTFCNQNKLKGVYAALWHEGCRFKTDKR